jgi:hypothetical protein
MPSTTAPAVECSALCRRSHTCVSLGAGYSDGHPPRCGSVLNGDHDNDAVVAVGRRVKDRACEQP